MSKPVSAVHTTTVPVDNVYFPLVHNSLSVNKIRNMFLVKHYFTVTFSSF